MGKQVEGNEILDPVDYSTEETEQYLNSRSPCGFPFNQYYNMPLLCVGVGGWVCVCVCVWGRHPAPIWRQFSSRIGFLNSIHSVDQQAKTCRNREEY